MPVPEQEARTGTTLRRSPSLTMLSNLKAKGLQWLNSHGIHQQHQLQQHDHQHQHHPHRSYFDLDWAIRLFGRDHRSIEPTITKLNLYGLTRRKISDPVTPLSRQVQLANALDCIEDTLCTPKESAYRRFRIPGKKRKVRQFQEQQQQVCRLGLVDMGEDLEDSVPLYLLVK
ncbi:hypothetical protein HDU81_006227 [Chytriomyces hyalinus]|nr:hypothetical protein HDU81_006227 [Chytriomyces hyalinus]